MENKFNVVSQNANHDYYVRGFGDMIIKEYGESDQDVQAASPYVILSDSHARFSITAHIQSKEIVEIVKRLVQMKRQPQVFVQLGMRTTSSEQGVFDANVLVGCQENIRNQLFTICFFLKCRSPFPNCGLMFWEASASKRDKNAFASLVVPPKFQRYLKRGAEIVGIGEPSRFQNPDDWAPVIYVKELLCCFLGNELRYSSKDIPFDPIKFGFSPTISNKKHT